MTIYFEKQIPEDKHICKYRIVMSRYHDYIPIREDESEELFKQMSKELGYEIKKKEM